MVGLQPKQVKLTWNHIEKKAWLHYRVSWKPKRNMMEKALYSRLCQCEGAGGKEIGGENLE